MSNDKKQKKNKLIVYEVTEPKDRKESLMSIFQIIAIVVPIIISAIALVVSLLSAQYQLEYAKKTHEYQKDSARYQKESYEYQLDPVVNVSASFLIQYLETEEGRVAYTWPNKFHAEIQEENNLEQIYLISPDYAVKKLKGADFTAEMDAYFMDAYKDMQPDLTIGDTGYFYRFIVYSSLDDSLELKLVYLKATQGVNLEESHVSWDEMDKVTIMEAEKAHEGDPDYEGERIMAAKFREILEFYKDLNN